MSETTLPRWQQNLVLRIQRFIHWLSKHWLALANFFVFLYVGLPFAAPVFMKIGWTGPARAIYTVYKPLCHQLAFRSWFLFGEEPVYPRAEFEEHFELSEAGWSEIFAHGREFIGDEVFGFKIAFCQRDIAIYAALLLGGLAYALLRRRGIRPMPFWLFVLVGVLPMGLDGGSQFITLVIPGFPARESVWQLRLITGALFGLSIAWLAYPYIQEGMEDTRQILASRYGWDGQVAVKQPAQLTTRDEVTLLLKDRNLIEDVLPDQDDERLH